MATEAAEDVIEVRVDDIAQLFHTLDPFPFREKDLDREAEEFIVGWARELAGDQPIKIIIHFPGTEIQTKTAMELSEAFARYFSERTDAVQRDLNELFRVGRRSLAIGVTILIACLMSAHFVVGVFVEPPFKRLAEESNIITLHIERSSFPNWEGTDQQRKFEFVGDELRYTAASSTANPAEAAQLVWKRVR